MMTPMIDKDYHGMLISELELTVRAWNVLNNAGFKTIADVYAFTDKGGHIRLLKGCGRGTERELCEIFGLPVLDAESWQRQPTQAEMIARAVESALTAAASRVMEAGVVCDCTWPGFRKDNPEKPHTESCITARAKFFAAIIRGEDK